MRKRVLSGILAVLTGGVALLAGELNMAATRNGFMIKSEVADLTTMTSVIVCVPPFREKHFYNITDDVEFVNQPDAVEIVQKGPKNKVDIEEYSVTRDGDSLILTLTAQLTHADPTDMENTLLVTPEYLLADSTYEAYKADGTRLVGAITPAFEGEIQVKHVMEDVVKATFTNAYGTLTLEVLDGPSFLVGDRRGVVFEERRCFWIGHQVPMTPDKKYNSKVRLTYVPNPKLTVVEPLAAANRTAPAAVTAAGIVSSDYEFTPPLVPVPKAIEYFKTPAWVKSADAKVTVDFDESFGKQAIDERLLKKVEAQLGQGGNGNKAIRILLSQSGEGMLIPPANPEGYVLQVKESEILLISPTERGAFYGLQTLKSLTAADGSIPAVLVRDWPDMQMRAVHFMLPDRDAYALLSRIIADVMVPMKMNTFIMECEFVHWESIPELHVKWGLSKEDCQKLIALCEENFIDPIPLMQTLSHMPWLFSNGQNKDMCEDLANPYAYFTSHPDLYPLMEKVFDEVRETFHNPAYLHIGHDELYTWAKYPNRPESIAIGTPKLVYDDVMWYYNYAKKHNAKIMMWHDIFVTKEESPENGHGGGDPDWVDTIRPDLPRDIVFCVWRYAGKTDRFLDLEHLAAEGFEVAGSSWFEINNVETLTKATKEVGGLGMISTTWIYPEVTGENNSVITSGCHDALDKWFIQMAPYTRSGAWSWNASDRSNKFDGKELFASLLEPARNTGVKSGKMVDLSSAANINITEKGNPFLTRKLYGFEALKAGELQVGRVKFQVPGNADGAAAVALKSRLNPKFPAEVNINMVPTTAKELCFFHTTLGIQPNPKDVVANYVISYADGTSAELPVRYQHEIAPPEEDVNYRLSTGNMFRFMNGKQRMGVWYASYANPYPEKTITGIKLVDTASENPFYLFGITLID